MDEEKTTDEQNPIKPEEPKVTEPVKEKQVKVNFWKVLSVILAVVVIYLLVQPPMTGFAIFGGGNGDVGERVVNYVNSLSGGTTTVTLKEVTKESGLDKVTLAVPGYGDMDFYVSSDGKLLLQGMPFVDVDDTETQTPVTPTTPDIPKSDKPVVEAFVMSHCPYGTQIEKGLLPVVKTLGDKIDFELKFVYYAMHADEEVYEQLNQYCIQKEQNDKFLDYLECFLTDGDGERCLVETGIDIEALNTCTEAADEEFSVTANLEDTASWLSGRFPLFDVHKADNDKYGVGGSPTLVINGVVAQVSRDSASLLTAICDAFNVAPDECNTEFEVGNPSPGFGWDETSSTNLAGCGV